jgi:hypothetical protein
LKSTEPPRAWLLDLVRVGSWGDRELAQAAVVEHQRAGITIVMLPSGRCIGVWDVEVPAHIADEATAIIAGVLVA